MMKMFSILLLGFLLLISQQCKSQDELPDVLFQKWIHSHEEDSAGYEVYRPADYAFPPARGRDGFEIGREQTFIYYAIAPADGNQAVKGQWKLVDNNMLEVELRDRNVDGFRLELIRVEEDRLLVNKQ